MFVIIDLCTLKTLKLEISNRNPYLVIVFFIFGFAVLKWGASSRRTASLISASSCTHFAFKVTTVHNLQKNVIGLRLANIYDLSPRVFLFKLSRPDFKKTLIIESGIRIHSTNFIRDKGDHTPAPFSITLRKYLKTKRLESVRQLGVDRIVDFTFGSGVATQHVIVELFSIGNIILTDGDYKVLAILRTHQYTENDNIAVGDVYPVDKARPPSVFTEALVDNIIQQAADKKDTLKQVFNKSLDFGPELIEHCILMAGLSPSLKIESYNHEEHASKLIEAFKEGQKIFDVAVQSKGFIVLKPPKVESKQQQQQKKKAAEQQQLKKDAIAGSGEEAATEEKKELVVYEEFVPYLYKQYQDKKYLEYDSFDLAVDQFFSEIESQKVEQQRMSQEQTVLKKLDKVREDQQRRIDSLYASEGENIKKAQLIESNLQDVDQCILIIRSGVAASMDWGNLNQLLKEEKKKNPYSVANKIHKLKLDTNQITLSLTDLHLDDDEDEEDEDENSDDDSEDEEKKKKNQKKNAKKPVFIDVDISLSAYANARNFYDSKKQSHEKAEKTIQQADFALKAAEKKARQQLSEVKTKSSMQQMRKVFWFEKFHWFISSDNYIVISGKDAQQNELLFKKYLDKDDVYVHADIFGSTSCVIKNPKGGEIPPNTLIQAGTMTMCYSNAWSAKVVTSAYWVYSHQVSKTAPSGEFLTTGSFMIRGKKNYLPHSQLVMGFGFMFKIDDSCIANHLGERSSGSSLLRDSMDGDHDEDMRMEELPDDSKHLRKFERTKLKREKEEEKFMEMDGMQVSEDLAKTSSTTTTTTSSTTTSTTSTNTQKDDKYKIKLVSSYKDDEDDDDEEEEEEGQGGDDDDKSGKKTKYITAAERRKMKKEKEKATKKDGDEEFTITNQAPPPKPVVTPKEEIVAPVLAEKPQKKSTVEPQKHMTMSQKNKLKKIQERYGHQDEEERKLAMELLGSAGAKKEKRKDKKKDKKNNKNQPQPTKGGKQPAATVAKKEEKKPIIVVEEKKETQVEKVIETPILVQEPQKVEEEEEEESSSEEDDDNEEEEEGIEDKEKKRKSRKEKREDKIKEQEEIKKLLEEENESTVKVDDNIFSNIDTLTGNPLENDILHFAIPVVGPYTIFNNYKYKVKLTPGHQKRGKAAKQAAATLLGLKNITAREKELIKIIKDEDISANMLADVRLHAPNLLATKKKEKAEKKAKATEKFNEEAQAKKEKEQQKKPETTTTTTTTTTNNTKEKK
ncbi:DUF814 family protein [Cavenderia fasciculata]|uniref:Ribosome quality control complex subunit 2 n=1 Tax=Cavenderia fasciculata TaxID=261658 RepID=F4QET2_CACFS|nr:DUF814 family protein [Cavenderia fasciculata]EGG13343.1 DUF814 family protein [Cavenderia fasciculata]|eukprot:XP_004350047.1 DUF814 family protein [Cavenderia fasciculata]